MLDMNYETIELEKQGDGVLIISLNRPDRLNAISHQMLDELTGIWNYLKHDLETRVVILRGSGDKGFCGGLDVKDGLKPEEFDPIHFYDFQTRLGELLLLMRNIPQPIIAAVHGAAAGGGFSLTMASDIRIITTDARFSAYYVNVGLGGADMSCSYFLPRLIGAGRAYEFMLTGRFMSAEEAMSLGFASRCVEFDELMPVALEMAAYMTKKSYMAMRLTKEAINQNLDCGGLEAALRMEDRNQTIMVWHNIWANNGKALL